MTTETTSTLLKDLQIAPEMPRRKDFRIGCIGTGFIMSDCHLVAYRNAGFNPVAIAGRDVDKACSVAERFGIAEVFRNYHEMLAMGEVDVVDIAVPPDLQYDVIKSVVKSGNVQGVLAQKPLGVNYRQAREIVSLCESAGVVLAVNQNMRFDQSIRACRSLLTSGKLGIPVLGTIDMRAIPHWMPWQARQGWLTLRIMSIHHLDTFRFLFGDPVRVFASVRPDPRTEKQFSHEDGICLYILEYENGLRAFACDDVWTGPAREGCHLTPGINWRVEGTEGVATGTIGWPDYPARTPSTIRYTSLSQPDCWIEPKWDAVWFPDAFSGPMAQLLVALESQQEPAISGRDNLKTMALVEACYVSAREHRAVEIREILESP